MNNSSFIGIIGLGVMGRNLSLNILDHGYSLSVYNRIAEGEERLVADFLNENKGQNLAKGFTAIKPFLASLEKPRKVLLMVKAGKAIDEVIETLRPHLEPGDIIIDGGNSHYQDTVRREAYCKQQDLNFIGMGVSGGEEGARKGPSMMIGGETKSYELLGKLFESIAASDQAQKPCCAHIGPDGAGHFVKMVHNGIEYAEMQLLAELYDLLKRWNTNEEIAHIFSGWNKESLSSFLLEITIDILLHKTNDDYTLDLILDKAANKGTGGWSVKAALELGTPNSMMAAAVFARYLSSQKQARQGMARKLQLDTKSSTPLKIDVLKKAYTSARIINHHQGFELVKTASDTYKWNIHLAELARIWTNGCIIRSKLMQNCVGIFNKNTSILNNHLCFESISANHSAVQELIIHGIQQNIPLPCFQSAYTYCQSMSTDRLPANLIQAQRDYFGAHTYQRIDHPETAYFHTNWK